MILNNCFFWLLLCAHLLGDFYLQTGKMVCKKRNNCSSVFTHAAIYAVCVFILILPISNISILFFGCITVITHLILDLIKSKVQRIIAKKAADEITEKTSFQRAIELHVTTKIAYKPKKKLAIRESTEALVFCLDQVIHIAIIIAVAIIYAKIYPVALNPIGKFLLQLYHDFQISIKPVEFIRIIFVLLMIGKPTNIIIKIMNNKDKIKIDSNDGRIAAEYKNAGKIIGVLERMLIVLFLFIEQYSVIGLILTAKSLTRYNKISTDPAFAEYYLVGTLSSVLITVISVMLIQVKF